MCNAHWEHVCIIVGDMVNKSLLLATYIPAGRGNTFLKANCTGGMAGNPNYVKSSQSGGGGRRNQLKVFLNFVGSWSRGQPGYRNLKQINRKTKQSACILLWGHWTTWPWVWLLPLLGQLVLPGTSQETLVLRVVMLGSGRLVWATSWWLILE